MICAFLLGFATGEVTGGLPEVAGPPAGPAARAAEFEEDLADLVRLVEVAVRVV
jgi:hypothetical protein